MIVLVSALARLVLFSGFIGGDDFAYGWLSHEILAKVYPEIGGNVFAGRPLLAVPMALSIGLFGWSEFALVLPVLIASLIGIGCTYAIARILAGRTAAFLSSATLAVFPLDLVYSTTTTNDIVGSAVLALAALLALLSILALSNERTTAALVTAFASGTVVGLAPGVKISFVMGWIPLAIVMAAVVVARRRAWRAVASMIGGWACAQLVLVLFFWLAAGEPFKNYTVELGFNRAFHAQPYLEGRGDALLWYPRWTFGIRPAMADSDRFFPYGLFFPLVTICSIACLRWARTRTWFLVVWCVATLLLLEFWPLQVFPAYIPIHRLPRFLHLAAVPGALIVGTACALAVSRGRLIGSAAIALWIVYATHAVASSLTAVERHRDSMKDLRFAADIASQFDEAIVTDAEMRGYLLFRRGFADGEKFSKIIGANARVPANALVIVGGGRRIDMDPDWVERRYPTHVPEGWTKLADLPGEPRAWRRSRGAVFVTHAPSEIVSRDSTDAIGSGTCAQGRAWHLVDTIDVGDVISEAAHKYEVEGQTFSGERMMFNQAGLELEDDGRAFRQHYAFDVSGLVPGAGACIVKRVDPSARMQISRWSTGGAIVGDLSADRESVGTWLDVSIQVPAELITDAALRLREEFQAAAIDINAYRIEIYQETSK